MTEELRRLYDEWAKGNLLALQDDRGSRDRVGVGARDGEPVGGPATSPRARGNLGGTKEWLEPWEHYWMTADEFIEPR
jgi:hypothetical protein